MNEWALRPRFAHIGQTGPGEPPEDGAMNEMTLPFSHRIRTLEKSTGNITPVALCMKIAKS